MISLSNRYIIRVILNYSDLSWISIEVYQTVKKQLLYSVETITLNELQVYFSEIN